MVAFDTETGTNIIVYYQDLSLIPGGMDFTDEDFLDFNKEALTTTSFNFTFGDYTDTEIGPNSYKVMPVIYMDYGISQYFYVRRKDNYMLCILTAIPGGGDIGSVMANFTWIDGQAE
jgi:hypothetical protein